MRSLAPPAVRLDGTAVAHALPLLLTLPIRDLSVYRTDRAVTELLHRFFRIDVPAVFGPGVDSLLAALIPLLAEEVDEALIRFPSYPLYLSLCEFHGLRFTEVASHPGLAGGGSTWPPHPKRPSLVVLCNPENPTGAVLDPSLLHALFVENPRSWFIVDESYIDYCLNRSVILDAGRLPNVVVLRGVSKGYGLPGLRLGGAYSSNLQILDRVAARLQMSPSSMSGGVSLLSRIADSALLRSTLHGNMRARHYSARAITRAFRANGIAPCSSETNLVFGHVPATFEARLFDEASRVGMVYTRPGHNNWLDSYYSRLTEGKMSYFRLSCGLETALVVRTIRRVAWS